MFADDRTVYEIRTLIKTEETMDPSTEISQTSKGSTTLHRAHTLSLLIYLCILVVL
jgi:hypothetical protein